jgi:exodeoxyribonuclease VII small subunit
MLFARLTLVSHAKNRDTEHGNSIYLNQQRRPRGTHLNQSAPKKHESVSVKKPDFERSLARLEEVVGKLESPQLSLDEAMKLFEEGVGLSRECQKQLEEAEGRVEILLKKADGRMVAEPFETPESNS